MIDDATLRFWLDDCTYKDWYFYLGKDGDHQPWLQVHFVAHCAKTGRREEQGGRKWRLSRHMTKSEVVQTALKAVLTAVEHEVRYEIVEMIRNRIAARASRAGKGETR